MSSAVKIVAYICVAVMVSIGMAITKSEIPLILGLGALYLVSNSK